MVGEEIKAIISVERKVFHNGNDWGIYSVSVDKVKSGNPQTGKYKNNITIKGNMPELQDGMQYKLVAKEVNDKRFGLQYEIKSIASLIQINEDDEVGKKKYLCKLFTEKQVEAMYEALDDPFEVLKNNDAAKLVQVKGCGVQNAIRWVKKFKDNYSFSKIYIELEKYELTHKMISKLMDRYNNPDLVISKVKDNPYTLSEVPGIGWKKADEIAQKGGVEPYCIERIESYMCYYLENTGNEGRSYISPQELMDAIVENIGEEVPDLNVSEAIRDLGDKLWYNKDKTKIGLMKYRRLEENIANEFKRLLGAENTFEYNNWDKVVKTIEQEQGWEYTEEQRNGIFIALEKNVVIIEGKAGCGKTTIANAFVKVLENYSCAQAALSGRAGARLAETTGEEGFTIHRLLRFPNKNENDNHMFAFNEDNPLPYDIIIVDEVSMIGGRLFLNLLKAIPTGAKLIMLGDVGQLPPIGECNVAADIIASEYIPTVSLTQIHRQAAKSAIITDSIKIREGNQIIDKDWVGLETRGELQDFTIDCFSDKSNTYYKVLQHYSAELEKVESVLDIQVITPVKNQGDCCTYSLNNAIQELYNPKNNKSDKEIVGYSNGRPYVLRVGDKVINRKNNYKVSSMDGKSVGLFNGDIGIVHSISDDGAFMEVDFTDRGRYFLDKDVIDNLELAYAITCHSFQGSQAERVIVALDYSSFILLSREWVYTAVTRAQKHCTLVCQSSALRYAIGKENVNDKTTHLVECVEEAFNPKIIF